MMKHLRKLYATLLMALGLSVLRIGTPLAVGQEGQYIDVVVHSLALEENLLEDSSSRNVTIYLPPNYEENPTQRFPVVYLLHGYTGNNRLWKGAGYLGSTFNIRDMADALLVEGKIKPMILVAPSARNKYEGSFYTNSSVTGLWERFIVQELVEYIDNNYRTLAQVESRGITGHSMGGFGTLKLPMKYPGVYSAAYGMSSCCLGFVEREEGMMAPSAWERTLKASSFSSAGFFGQLQLAMATAFSPNPDAMPFLADLPYEEVGGEIRLVEEVWNRWVPQMPIGMLEQYGANLMQLRGYRFDVGTQDFFIHIPPDNRAFSAALTEVGIPHVFEEYDGNHNNRVKERMETLVLPFFSDILSFELEPTAVEETTWGQVKVGVPD